VKDVVTCDIKRYVEIVLYLSFSRRAMISRFEEEPKLRDRGSYFLFKFAHGWLYRKRSINFRVLASTTSTTAMTSTGIPQDDSPLSWFFTSKLAQVDRDINFFFFFFIRRPRLGFIRLNLFGRKNWLPCADSSLQNIQDFWTGELGRALILYKDNNITM